MRRTLRSITLPIALALLLAPATAAHATFPGTNGRIVYASGGDIFMIDADGSDRSRLTAGPASDSAPAFSPDGRWVAFTRYRPATDRQPVFIIGVDGSALHRVSSRMRGYGQTPVWAPNGRWLAFEDLVIGEEGPRGGALFVVRRNGKELTQLTGYRGRSFQPSWSADSARLTFANDGIVVVDRDGTDRARLTAGATHEEYPCWSPTGDRILFSRTMPGSPEQGDLGMAIVSIAQDGTDERTLTDGLGFDMDAQWSPDGSRIAFLDLDPFAGSDLWIMDADGSDQRGLTTGRVAGQGFAWTPDGTAIVYDDWSDLRMIDAVTGSISRVTTSPGMTELLGDWQALSS